MRAAVLAVGSELLGVDRLDTNSLALTRSLRDHGVALCAKAVVGDDGEEIAETLRRLCDRADLVLMTGGLGPTTDDLTREAVARALGRELVFRDDILAGIAEKFASFGLRLPEINRREAFVIEGAEVLENTRGTAPGLRVDHDSGSVFLFPGVPRELEAMIAGHLEPWLRERSDGAGTESRVLKVACVAESHLEEQLEPAYAELGAENVTVLGSPGEIRVVLSATGPEATRRARLESMVGTVREILGPTVFAGDEATTLEGVVGGLLVEAGETVVTAESCTGGWIAQRITGVPGSSGWFLGGAVVYSNDLKSRLLGVAPELIESRGAVSEPVARAMAEGARRRLGSDWAVATTGIAGPDGGSDEKPVGTVHLAVAGPGGTSHRLLRLPPGRDRVRAFATQWALDLLRRRLAGIRAELVR